MASRPPAARKPYCLPPASPGLPDLVPATSPWVLRVVLGVRVAEPLAPGTFSRAGTGPALLLAPPHETTESRMCPFYVRQSLRDRHSQHIFMMMSRISHSWGGEGLNWPTVQRGLPQPLG